METAIRFERVSYRWVDEDDGAATPVFAGLDLELPPGHRVAGRAERHRHVDPARARRGQHRAGRGPIVFQNMEFETDEPIFALEDRQKERAMEYLCAHARREGVGRYFSLHELDLSRRYSDHLLLFGRGSPPRLGPTAELFTRETIERANGVPFELLKTREALYRTMLIGTLAVRGGPGGSLTS